MIMEIVHWAIMVDQTMKLHLAGQMVGLKCLLSASSHASQTFKKLDLVSMIYALHKNDAMVASPESSGSNLYLFANIVCSRTFTRLTRLF